MAVNSFGSVKVLRKHKRGTWGSNTCGCFWGRGCWDNYLIKLS